MNSEAIVFFPNADSVRQTTGAVSGLSNETSPASKRVGSATAETSDDSLLSQVGLGSKDALGQLFRRHRRAVFHVASRILRDAAEAEDLCQDVFLYLFEKAKLFDMSKGTASSWIIQITYHRAINRKQYLGVRQHYTGQELDEEQIPLARQGTFINEIDARALLNRLRGELSRQQWHTLELFFFDGYSLREIAEKTSQTLGSVRHHYYRGLERLRAGVFPQKDA